MGQGIPSARELLRDPIQLVLKPIHPSPRGNFVVIERLLGYDHNTLHQN
jgi:hypothetical protein